MQVAKLDHQEVEYVGNHPMYGNLDTDTAELPEFANPFSPKCFLSYGTLAIVNLDRDLTSEFIEKRFRALSCLSRLFHSPQNVSQGLNIKIVDRLLTFFSSDNSSCRQRASDCVMLISRHSVGRACILQSFEKLVFVAKDKDSYVRKNVHETLSNLTMMARGVEMAFEFHLFQTICQEIGFERPDIQIFMLDTCYKCIRGGNIQIGSSTVIQFEALDVFTNLARKSKPWEVQEFACKCIMVLCFFHDCKGLAVKSNTLTAMIGLLTHTRSEVRAASSGALMAISILTDAKHFLVRDENFNAVSNLLDDESESVRLNAMKTIANCAEDHRGRLISIQHLEKVMFGSIVVEKHCETVQSAPRCYRC